MRGVLSMARKDTRYDREASDEAYNARRRFARKAKKYADMALNAVGELKARYETIARDALEDAISTYEKGTSKSEWSKNIRQLDERLKPVDVFRREAKQRISKSKLERSFDALTAKDEQMRRKREAKSILSTGAGSRIFAGTVDIWSGEDDDYRSREQALIEHFGVSDMMEVIELFEDEFGDELYADYGNQIKYDELVAMIAEFVSRGDVD